MGRVMYFEAFSGAAGDMLLGALLDAGLPLAALEEALGSLAVGHELRVTRVVRAGIAATHVSVIDPAGLPVSPVTPLHRHDHAHPAGGHRHDHDHDPAHRHRAASAQGGAPNHAHRGSDHRTLADIAQLIDRSALSSPGKARAKALFRRLGEAEAAIHDVPLDQVHLHEVGALDSIIDIVGAVFAFEWFGIDDVVVSPLNVGGGTVQIAHGRYPVPAPATARLLAGVPVYSAGPQVELLTPTGALLLSDYAKTFGAMPAMRIERVGYGAGTRDFSETPNVLRVMIGERTAPHPPGEGAGEVIVEIVCEIDDMSPQLFAPAMERLFASGALDVFLTPVQMKKNRPGILVTVLAPVSRRGALADVLFRETTTIGVRFRDVRRETLDRTWEDVPVAGGTVRMKIATRNGERLNVVPEFEDCLRVATSTGRPIKEIQQEALHVWRSRPSAGG